MNQKLKKYVTWAAITTVAGYLGIRAAGDVKDYLQYKCAESVAEYFQEKPPHSYYR